MHFIAYTIVMKTPKKSLRPDALPLQRRFLYWCLLQTPPVLIAGALQQELLVTD